MRRRLVSGATLLAACPRGAVGAIVAADGGLFAAATAFCALERRRQDLIEGRAASQTTACGKCCYGRCATSRCRTWTGCSKRALGLVGHRAWAAAFALWDADNLADLVEANGFPVDRPLAALVRFGGGVVSRRPATGAAQAGPGRYVVVRDRDGLQTALTQHVVSAACEPEEGGAVLLSGEHLVQAEENLDTGLAWLE